jgi:hypothetical protein
MTISNSGIPAEIISAWDKAATKCANPLGLDEKVLQDSLEDCPPREYEGGTFLGRFLIPRSFVVYDEQDQPRQKGCDTNHVTNLYNNYIVKEYMTTEEPPIASFNDGVLNSSILKPHSGFNRYKALDRLGQEIYIYDVYEFESRYWEVIAASASNHHSNPQLSQTNEDYLKVVTNAVNAQIIPADEDSIRDFVNKIATDKTSQARKTIVQNSLNNCEVYPNFRVFSSTGSGKNTLNGFVRSNKLAKQGVGGRKDFELANQGYLLYTADSGDAVLCWSRGIYQGTRLGLPVWIIGYSTNFHPDIYQFRRDFIDEFNKMKGYQIQNACNIANGGNPLDEIDEDKFPVKLAGFLPQWVRPNDQNHGKPSEIGLVDIDGNTLTFDPKGQCLTLR